MKAFSIFFNIIIDNRFLGESRVTIFFNKGFFSDFVWISLQNRKCDNQTIYRCYSLVKLIAIRFFGRNFGDAKNRGMDSDDRLEILRSGAVRDYRGCRGKLFVAVDGQDNIRKRDKY